MKKIVLMAVAMLLMAGTMSAQNTFKGTVKYKLESTGKVSVNIPAEQSTFEIKVYENKLMVGNTIQDGLKVTSATDLSQLLFYLQQNDIVLESYQGDGKIIVRNTTTKEELDSLTIVDQEPGHFYYEYVNETKDILGYAAKKMIIHTYDDQGVDAPVECWYTDQIGPEYCILLGNMHGFPLVYTQMNEGKAITYTATEIVSGKVKSSDLLLPAGYKDLTEEEFEALQKELQVAFDLLGD